MRRPASLGRESAAAPTMEQLDRRDKWYARGAIASLAVAATIGFSEQTKFAESYATSNYGIGGSLAVMAGFCLLGMRNDRQQEVLYGNEPQPATPLTTACDGPPEYAQTAALAEPGVLDQAVTESLPRSDLE